MPDSYSIQQPTNPSFQSGAGSQSGSGTGTSTSGTQITPGMLGVYNQLLSANQQNYQNVLSAYTGGQQRLSQSLPGIYGDYGGLSNQVMGILGLGGGGWGVAAPAAQQIGQTFAKQQGQSQQKMIDAGLGNTTVGQNLANQNTLFAEQAYGGLGAQLAQTAAGYQSQIGLAGLQARMSGLGMQSDLTKAGLGPLGQQFSNTAGSLTGSYGKSAQEQNQQAQNTSRGAGGGGGGGYSQSRPSSGDGDYQPGRNMTQSNITDPAPTDYSGYNALATPAYGGQEAAAPWAGGAAGAGMGTGMGMGMDAGGGLADFYGGL